MVGDKLILTPACAPVLPPEMALSAPAINEECPMLPTKVGIKVAFANVFTLAAKDIEEAPTDFITESAKMLEIQREICHVDIHFMGVAESRAKSKGFRSMKDFFAIVSPCDKFGRGH